MINTALDFISKEINAYLNNIASTNYEDYIVVSSIVYDGKLAIPDKTLGLTLINIEEEHLAKNQQLTVRNMQDDIKYRNPDISLNLSIVISANFHNKDSKSPQLDYLDGLKRLSQVISFFQYKSVFTQANSPLLVVSDSKIERLSAELISFNFEKINHFWSIIGHSYLPSVVYKIRMSTIQENAQYGGIIKNISTQNKNEL
ncbi:DUF4255 domain-containing protein [Pedobacter sp. Leaf250]|uniref:DUF4255 domain-containing protein n=1 Tax=Pedobacter sp. Leaf250 TaxID=2876559 RepID=UPI001E4E4247|nr:DUF4255 domain-containing protein [Pedobacter sp. Leaf250]